jgi:hypothetical protein
MHFGENQLSLGSLGISPLPTAHPSLLPQTPVRASTPHYGSFTLAMGSSPSFGSPPTNNVALFRLAFALAPALHALTVLVNGTRRIILQ